MQARVRASITEIVPANPALNLATTPAVSVLLDRGGAAFEAEFVDSQTNEVQAAMVYKQRGNPLDPRFYRGVTTMGYARAAFEAWVLEHHGYELRGKPWSLLAAASGGESGP